MSSSFVRYKNAYTHKIAFLFLVFDIFFRVSMCCCCLIPLRLLLFFSILLLLLLDNLTKTHAYFYESLLLLCYDKKVSLWYATHPKARNREKCCLLLFRPLCCCVHAYDTVEKCAANRFLCKCHLKNATTTNYRGIVFAY